MHSAATPDARASSSSRAPQGQRSFAVIDAAQDATFLFLRDGAAIRRQSLYAGELGAMLDDVAPHLMEFQRESAFSDWLMERWDRNCGIVLQTEALFEDVRKHLRRFLLVKNEAGARYRFRFYDPRVLRAFLPSCTPEEAVQFFGQVRRICVPDADAGHTLQFALEQTGLRRVRLPGRQGWGLPA